MAPDVLVLDMYGRKACTQPAITQVCRQLRHEALPLYYELNGFMVTMREDILMAKRSSKTVLAKWLRAIGPENIKRIRKIGVLVQNPVFSRAELRSLGIRYPADVTLQEFLRSENLELARETQIETISC